MLHKTIKRIHQEPHIWFLIAALFIFAMLRVPSLIEPYWYGDEGVTQVMGNAWRDGRLLYKEIVDNKPPLLYMMYGILGGDLFAIKTLSLVFGLGSIGAFFYLAKKVFTKNYSLYVAVGLYSFFFAIPLLEGNIASAENFMHLPTFVAMLLGWNYLEKSDRRLLMYAGLLLSFSFLIKIVGIFDCAALVVFLAILHLDDWGQVLRTSKKSVFKFIQSSLRVFYGEILLILSFLAPIVIVSLYFVMQGGFFDYWSAVFGNNVGYVGTRNYFLFPMSILIFKLIALVLLLGVVVYKRNALAKEYIFILIWVAFGLFSSFFSQRPYTHYLLLSLPPLSLLAGYIIENRRLTVFNSILLVVACVLMYTNFTIYKKNVGYYLNYMNFIVGQKDFQSYQRFFDSINVRDYEIARFIRANTKPEDGVFLWSNSPQIYALANKLPPGKYIAAYHVTFYADGIEQTHLAIEKSKPKFIIATEEAGTIPEEFISNYDPRYQVEGVTIYGRSL